MNRLMSGGYNVRFFFAVKIKNGKTALIVSTKKSLAYPLVSADLDAKKVISSRCRCVAF